MLTCLGDARVRRLSLRASTVDDLQCLVDDVFHGEAADARDREQTWFAHGLQAIAMRTTACPVPNGPQGDGVSGAVEPNDLRAARRRRT